MGFEKNGLSNLFSKKKGKKKNIPGDNLFSKNEESSAENKKSFSKNEDQKIDNSEPEIEINEKRNQASSEVQDTSAEKEEANLNSEKEENKEEENKEEENKEEENKEEENKEEENKEEENKEEENKEEENKEEENKEEENKEEENKEEENKEEENKEEGKENKEKISKQETIKVDPNSGFDYRKNLEAIKIKEGNVQKSEYSSFEKVSQDFKEEIKNISDSLVAQELDKNLDNNLQNLADKTSLPLETIKEIYKSQEESLVAEAKAEINKNTSTAKKIGIALGKSGIYVGAGILSASSTVASLGIGVGVGMGIIAGARILDRLVTEGRLKKKLDAKIKEVKDSKTDEDKEALAKRLTAAISLQKQMEIDKVDLGNEGQDRDAIIDKYVDTYVGLNLSEQEKDSLGASSELIKYKDNISRSLKGLDNIDKLNNQREEKINKITFIDKMKKVEDKISGTSVKEKTVSTSVFVGLGLAARELPVIRQIMMGYAGYRLGSMAGNYMVRKDKFLKNSEIERNSNGKFLDYSVVKRKILDHDFQKNHPEEYIKLKKELDVYENSKIQEEPGAEVKKGIENLTKLNSHFGQRLEMDQEKQRYNNISKVIIKGSGAALGVIAGSVITDLTRELKNGKIFNTDHSSASGSSVIEDGQNIKGPDGGNSNLDISNDSLKTEAVPLDSTQNLKVENAQGGIDTSSVETPSTKKFIAEYEAKYDTGFEDKISNSGLKVGQHDSVWRSTNQIFKDHAQDLGYKGDLNDSKALEAWSQNQTGNTLENTQHNINASGNPAKLHDKVFEGNKIVLKKNLPGNDYRIVIEKDTGLNPGNLNQNVKENIQNLRSKNIEDITEIPRSSDQSSNLENSSDNIEIHADKPLSTDIQNRADILYANNLTTKHLGNHHLIKLIKGLKGDALTRDQKILIRQFNHKGDYDKASFHELINKIIPSKVTNHNQEIESVADISKIKTPDSSNVVNDKVIEGVSGNNKIQPEQDLGPLTKDLKPNVSVLNPESPKLHAEISDSSQTGLDLESAKVSTADLSTKAFKSIDNLSSLAENTKVPLGNLTMIKSGSDYNFINQKGESFNLIINNKNISNSSYEFDISKNSRILGRLGDSQELKQALDFKESIYNNLPDQNSSFAIKLLKDIQKGQIRMKK